jgi:hypothetical protein
MRVFGSGSGSIRALSLIDRSMDMGLRISAELVYISYARGYAWDSARHGELIGAHLFLSGQSWGPQHVLESNIVNVLSAAVFRGLDQVDEIIKASVSG